MHDALALDALANDAQSLFEDESLFATGEMSRPTGACLGPDLSVLSVGEATRAGDRAVRLPVVLGDSAGGTSTLVLTIRLDVLAEEDSG